ncbi:MPN domain-containing protein-like [Sarcoptes scabiei]|nr:MPN domain-containing protein-like [Sarcoptes scabiei]
MKTDGDRITHQKKKKKKINRNLMDSKILRSYCPLRNQTYQCSVRFREKFSNKQTKKKKTKKKNDVKFNQTTILNMIVAIIVIIIIIIIISIELIGNKEIESGESKKLRRNFQNPKIFFLR